MFDIDIKGSPHSHPVRPIHDGSGSGRLNRIWLLVILKGIFWILFLLFCTKLDS